MVELLDVEGAFFKVNLVVGESISGRLEVVRLENYCESYYNIECSI